MYIRRIFWKAQKGSIISKQRNLLRRVKADPSLITFQIPQKISYVRAEESKDLATDKFLNQFGKSLG